MSRNIPINIEGKAIMRKESESESNSPLNNICVNSQGVPTKEYNNKINKDIMTRFNNLQNCNNSTQTV